MEMDDIPVSPAPLPAVIESMHRAGLSTDFIASSLAVPLPQVRAVVIQLRGQPRTVLDEELAEEVRSLAAHALKQAHRFLEFGTASQQMSIVKVMLSGLSKHVASSVGGEQEEARQALTVLLEEMKTVPEMEPFVSAESPVSYHPVIETTADTTEDDPFYTK